MQTSHCATPSIPILSTSEVRALSRRERRDLLRFVSAILWADARVTASGCRFFVRLASQLGYGPRDAARALDVLASPPTPEEVDPARVSAATARVLLRVAREAARAASADGASLAAHEHARLLESLVRARAATCGVARCA
jgi:hypothetical protein